MGRRCIGDQVYLNGNVMRLSWQRIVYLGFGLISMLAHSREQDEIVLTVLYDNFEDNPALMADWGFSCLIHGMEQNILFDTGADEEILKRNFDQYGYYRQGVETLVISHLHRDHIGGIGTILDYTHGENRKVYFPERIPGNLTGYEEKHTLIPVTDTTELCKDVYTTGVMGGVVPEQGLILDTEQGLILIVGCSHPGIVKMTERVRTLFPNRPVHLIVGGFHLLNENDAIVRDLAERLRVLGVEQIAPTHCTGERAKMIFKDVFGADYLEAGVGKVFRFPRTLPIMKGPYFGLGPPGKHAVVFAPGILATQHLEHSAPSFSKDGKEVYWSRWLRPNNGEPQVIMTARVNEKGEWVKPEVASFSGVYKDGGPKLINHDRSLIFGSKRSLIDESGDADTWHLFRVDRTKTGWTDPQIVTPEGTKVSDFLGSPSMADNGNLYLTFNGKTCVSRFEDGRYLYPEPLSCSINSGNQDWTPFIAPDERYLIFSSERPGGYGMGDLYISAKRKDGSWSKPMNMGESVNTGSQERFPSLSSDGKYFFFTRWTFEYDHDIYWVSAEVIEDLIAEINSVEGK